MRALRRSAWLSLLVVGTALALLGARELKDQLVPKNFVVVEPGFLYRSGELPARRARAWLERLHIRRVVWLLYPNAEEPNHRAEQAAIAELGIRSVNLSLHGDGTGKLGRFAEAIAEVAEARRAGEAVLVQCGAGARRSGGVVALYQLLVEGRSPEEAYREIARFGAPEAIAHQVEFLNANMADIAGQLARRGTIAAVPYPVPQLRAPPAGWMRTRLALAFGGAPPR